MNEIMLQGIKHFNVDDNTKIPHLYDYKIISARSVNGLWRAGYKEVGMILQLKAEDLMQVKNLGNHSIEEIEDFIDAYNQAKPSADGQTMVCVEELLEYCEKCGAIVRSIANTILDKVGHGESETSALGGCAYFMQREAMYRYEIPNVIKSFLEENKKENDSE